MRGRDLGQRSDAVNRSVTEDDLTEESIKGKTINYQTSCCNSVITLATVTRPGDTGME